MPRTRNRTAPRSLESFPPVFRQIVELVQTRDHVVKCGSPGEAYGLQLEFYRYIASVRAAVGPDDEMRREVDSVFISKKESVLTFKSRLRSAHASRLEASLATKGIAPNSGEALLESLQRELGADAEAENPYYRREEK